MLDGWLKNSVSVAWLLGCLVDCCCRWFVDLLVGLGAGGLTVLVGVEVSVGVLALRLRLVGSREIDGSRDLGLIATRDYSRGYTDKVGLTKN